MAHPLSRPIAAAFLAATFAAGPAAAISLPFDLGFGRGERAAEPSPPAPGNQPVNLAQMNDGGVRVSQMEEEMRRLTGKVEELSFLVLQLQEQLRKTQEDNEFRFQDLEGGAAGSTAAAPDQRSDAGPAASGSGDGEFAAGPSAPATAPLPPAGGTLALPSSNSGTLTSAPTTDEIGAILDTTSLGNLPAPAAPGAPPAAPSQSVAAISPNGPGEMYGLAYNYLLAGDYQLAEATFRQYAQTYPDSADAPDAQYWLGESLFAQSKFRDAAEVFLNAQKAHPDSGKAPEMMLKLGMSLARLDNRETACVTYAEVGKRYPEMSANVKRKLEAEEGSANCG